jgi:hypothetical protein
MMTLLQNVYLIQSYLTKKKNNMSKCSQIVRKDMEKHSKSLVFSSKK